jgi:hypothetical protein
LTEARYRADRHQSSKKAAGPNLRGLDGITFEGAECGHHAL